jgi:hypothetical protein
VRLCSSRMEVVRPSNAASSTFENSRLGVVTEAAEKSRTDCSGMKLSEARTIARVANTATETFIGVHSGMDGLKSRFQIGAFFFRWSSVTGCMGRLVIFVHIVNREC